MSIAKTFQMTPQGPQKMPGWHSWRHETRDAQDAAREKYLAEHGTEVKRKSAQQRQEHADGMTPSQRLVHATNPHRPGQRTREIRRWQLVAR